MEFISGTRTLGKEKGEIKLWAVGIMVLSSFLISRAVLFDGMFPAGIALITVLISINALHFYLLPVILIGLGSYFGTGYELWGDMGAVCGCALVFMCTGKVNFRLWHKAVIAGSVSIISNSIYYMAAKLLYKISITDLVTEALIVAILCFSFHGFYSLAEEKKTDVSEPAVLVSAICVFSLLLCGTEFQWIIMPAVLAMTLFVGYIMGIYEGIACGFVSGAVLFSCGMPALFTVPLLIGGLTAGLLKGHNKVACALCFSAVLLGIGGLDIFQNATGSYLYPLAASFLLMIMPHKWVGKLDAQISNFMKNSTYHEKRRQAAVSAALANYKKIFDGLSMLYASPMNNRSVVSYQFRGLSHIMAKLNNEIQHAAQIIPERYGVESGWACYSRSRDVSGDSHLWADLEDGRFAIVLSDGMGKGARASSESNLVVTTLINLLKAGLEVELILKMVNSILLLNSAEEMLSTVDLGILDKKSGKMKFYKIGAAPTIIKHKSSVEMVKMSAMPMGIVDGLKIDYVTVTLRPGDQVIMMSDGVMDSRREDLSMNWLMETVGEIKSKDPQTMCDLIINRAVENYGLKEKDDLTVLAVRLN